MLSSIFLYMVVTGQYMGDGERHSSAHWVQTLINEASRRHRVSFDSVWLCSREAADARAIQIPQQLIV